VATARTLSAPAASFRLSLLASFPATRVLTWSKNSLYASSEYRLIRADFYEKNGIVWSPVAQYRPSWIRSWSSRSRLAERFLRDGFHALAVLSSGHIVAAVPHAIVTLEPGDFEFRSSFQIRRGIRPLHIASTPDDCLYWGEYFDNRERQEVHIYASPDRGNHWEVAYTFSGRAIRHVHNIVYDKWQDCLWILTGDQGSECRVLRASRDLRNVDIVLSGRQQVRAVSLIPTEDALYFSSDTPLERNYIYRLQRSGNISQLAEISSSSIYGCAVGRSIFFSTMVEPSLVNLDRHSRVFGSVDTNRWESLLSWKKDRHSPRLFQYGNVMLPDGENSSELLALSGIAVEDHDLETSIWRIETKTLV
jgi:hypothetical protein